MRHPQLAVHANGRIFTRKERLAVCLLVRCQCRRKTSLPPQPDGIVLLRDALSSPSLPPSPHARPMVNAMEVCSIQFSRVPTAGTPTIGIARFISPPFDTALEEAVLLLLLFALVKNESSVKERSRLCYHIFI